MNKIKISQDFLIIAILTLLTTLVWVGTDAYHNFVTKRTNTIKKELMTPLNQGINQKIINDLEKKKYLSEKELTEILSRATRATPSASPEVTPSILPSPTATASLSPTIAPPPVATTSSPPATGESRQ